MKKSFIPILVIILIVIIGGLLVWYFTQEKPVSQNRNVSNVEVLVPPKDTVWIVEGNFTPTVLKVSTGEKVTWVNKDEATRRVASDPHPTSTQLPQLVSSDLTKDESFSFSFTQKGEWGYHDYLNPIKKGKVIVQ